MSDSVICHTSLLLCRAMHSNLWFQVMSSARPRRYVQAFWNTNLNMVGSTIATRSASTVVVGGFFLMTRLQDADINYIRPNDEVHIFP